MTKTFRDILAKYLAGLVYKANHHTLGKYWNSYAEADDFLDSFGVDKLSNFEAIYRDGNFYLKQPDGTYLSINSLSKLEV